MLGQCPPTTLRTLWFPGPLLGATTSILPLSGGEEPGLCRDPILASVAASASHLRSFPIQQSESTLQNSLTILEEDDH